MEVRYLSVVETAKMIRKELRAAFPYTKFSVRSDRFAGGTAIDVRWIDGPGSKVVEALVGHYHSKSFDGMIDMETSRRHWLLPDGSVVLAEVQGTTGSLGTIEDYRRITPHDDAELVSLGGGYLGFHRELSPAYLEALALDTARKYGVPAEKIKVNQSGDGTAYLDSECSNIRVESADEWFGGLVHRTRADEERAELEAMESRLQADAS